MVNHRPRAAERVPTRGERAVTEPESRRTALLRRDAEFAKEASEGRDVDRVVSYWSADAVVAPPGQPPVTGREALRRYVEDSYRVPGFNITWRASGDPQFSADSSMAYMWAHNEVSFNDADENLVSVRGRALTVWRLEDDGEWRCAADIWNDEPPS